MKEILKDKKNEDTIYNIAKDYKALLIKYLTAWKDR